MNEERVDDTSKLYTKEEFVFMCQHKLKSSFLRKLKEEFDVQEIMVLSEKKKEKVEEK